MKQFRLPDPGEGLTEADIVEWKVSPGDQVNVNDIVVEVETSKSLVELPSPYAGTVSQLLAQSGDTVEVGTPIVSIDDGTGSDEAPPADQPEQSDGAAGDQQTSQSNGQAGEPDDAPVPTLVGYGPRSSSTKRRGRKRSESAEQVRGEVSNAFSTQQPVGHVHGEPGPLQPAGEQESGGPLPGPGTPPAEPHPSGSGVLAKPPVRKLAKNLGVDLASVTGSGAGGVITREDVTSASTAAAPAAGQPQPAAQAGEAAPGASGQDVRIPIKGVRKATAQAMVNSAFTAPHVSEWVTCDVSATMELLERLRQRKEFAGLKLSPLLLTAKAALLALGRTRELNASWDDDAQEIVYHGQVNLGIAAATPRGLVVPNIKNAGRMSLAELAEALRQLIATARDGKAQPADLSGGTFSITNVGIFGVDGGTPILNPGESGILAVGSIDRKPWVVGSGEDERIVPRWVTTLGLSFDHRIVDGEQGSRFLSDIASILADPANALLY